MKIADWATFAQIRTELSSHPVLVEKGKVSALEETIKFDWTYDVDRKHHDVDLASDFDRIVEEAAQIEKSARAQCVRARTARSGVTVLAEVLTNMR